MIVEGPYGQASELRSEFFNRDRVRMQIRTERFRSISAYRDRADLSGYYPAGTAGFYYNPDYPTEDYVYNSPARYDGRVGYAYVYLPYSTRIYAIVGPTVVPEGESFTLTVTGPAGAWTYQWFVDGVSAGPPTEAPSYTGIGMPGGTMTQYRVEIRDSAGQFVDYHETRVNFTYEDGCLEPPC